MRIVHRAERIERKPYHPPSFENYGGTGESTKNQKHPPPLKLRRAGEKKEIFGRRLTGLPGYNQPLIFTNRH